MKCGIKDCRNSAWQPVYEDSLVFFVCTPHGMPEEELLKKNVPQEQIDRWKKYALKKDSIKLSELPKGHE